ncbi:MAG: hypothetical protein K2X66_12850 [Cyanobacteria bacterium]|nr:hypothetical protein [Cyanobacteriota bacterium]
MNSLTPHLSPRQTFVNQPRTPQPKFQATFALKGLPEEALKAFQNLDNVNDALIFNQEEPGNRIAPYIQDQQLMVLTDFPPEQHASNYSSLMNLGAFLKEKNVLSNDAWQKLKTEVRTFFSAYKESEIGEIDLSLESKA